MRGETGETSPTSTSGRVSCPLPSWVSNFAEALDNIVQSNTPSRARCGDASSVYLSAWHTLIDPKIPMQSYVERLWRYSGCSSAAAFGSLTYIDRLAASEDSFTPTAFNIHRLLTVTLVLAMKFFQEEVYPQDYLALVGGMTGAELNLLELEVLSRFSFNAFVSEQQLQLSVDVIRANLPGGRGCLFPSAANLLETLWVEDMEVSDEPPSTPPGAPPAAPPRAQPVHLAGARRWSDSSLPGALAMDESEDSVEELSYEGPRAPVGNAMRMRGSASEGCFGLTGRAAESSCGEEPVCPTFHSLDGEELLTSCAAREALGALLCDEVFEEGMADAFDGPAAVYHHAGQAGRLHI